MEWTSSAARGESARLFWRLGHGDRPLWSRIDPAANGWLKLASLIQLTLLAAALPLGPDVAVVAASAGAMGFLLVQRREPAAAPAILAVREPASLADAPEAHAAEVVGEPAPAPVPVAAARARAADTVWTDIMGQISHELRTPLNAIIGFSDLMGRELYGPVGDPRYQEYLGHIRDSGRSLLKSAEDTLALTELLASRSAEQSSPIIALDDLLAGCVARAAETGPAIVLDPEGARGLDVQGERLALQQVLLNALVEAQERAVGGGKVMVAVRESGSSALVEIDAPVASGSVGSPLRLALARMMLELNGGSLHEVTRHTIAGPVWRVTICLDFVRQPDLFRI